MCTQIRVRRSKASDKAIKTHLTAKQRKKLDRYGQVTITLPGDRQKQQRIRNDLGAVYVS